MKLRLLQFLLALFVSMPFALAQSMSDTQVVEYVKQQKSAGATSKMVVAELLAKGATREQLQRLYSNYNSGSSSQSTSVTTNAVGDRSRQNNGEKVDENLFENKPADARKVFGHDIFRSKNLSFEPNMSIATAPNYVLGPGDELIVDIFGASQSSNKYKVAPDGTVTIPRIGPVGVNGMTVDNAQARIQSALGSHYQNSSIKVSVGQTRTISISVMGEVKVPGTYTLSAFATAFHALYMAGGINDVGTLRNVKVARNGRIISTIDVYEYILNGRLAGDVKLSDNDVIIVGAYENLVNLSGNVKRPMWYEMKKNESLQSLLRFAGGFSGDAYTKSVTVNRRAGDMLSVYTVDEFKYTSFALSDQDEIVVRGNENRYSNLVVVSGAVKRPGHYELTAVTSVRGLIEAAGGLHEEAATTHAVITRMNEDRTLKTIPVDLEGIMNGTVADIPLSNEDKLTIASNARLNDERVMTIEGEVWNAGTFPFSENTTIRDLVTLAGGLKESASVLNVEVARRIIDPSAKSDADIKSETFTLSLNDTNDEKFTLKPYDKVYIRRSPVYNIQRTVSVTGEVMFAGNYTLKSNQVHLSDVIKNAGGFKVNASPHDARLVRQMDEMEIARRRQLLELKKDATDSISNIDLGTTYSVAIDLDEALKNPGSGSDIVLRDGDQIIVPQINTTVKVNGEVLYPNSVTYVAGKGYRYYINESGGFTKKSAKNKAYIIYANGHVSRINKGKIKPGCEIIVPTKPEKVANDANAMKWASLSTSVISASAILVNAIK